MNLANEKLNEALKNLLSDLFVEFFNYKQRHWHVQGLAFKEIHEFFDEATDQILELMDSVGEYIVSFGEIAPSTLSSVELRATITHNNEEERDAKPLLLSGLKTTKHLKSKFVELSKIADSVDELGVSNMADDAIQDLDVLIYKYQAYLRVF
jgi:starvation-inducible DNA-binding protein